MRAIAQKHHAFTLWAVEFAPSPGDQCTTTGYTDGLKQSLGHGPWIVNDDATEADINGRRTLANELIQCGWGSV